MTCSSISFFVVQYNLLRGPFIRHFSCSILLFLQSGSQSTTVVHCFRPEMRNILHRLNFWGKCEQLQFTFIQKKMILLTAFLVFMEYKKHPNHLEAQAEKTVGEKKRPALSYSFPFYPITLLPPLFSFSKENLVQLKFIQLCQVLRTYIRTVLAD